MSDILRGPCLRHIIASAYTFENLSGIWFTHAARVRQELLSPVKAPIGELLACLPDNQLPDQCPCHRAANKTKF